MPVKEVEIVPVLKRSFRLLIKDPGFVGLYLLPYFVLVIAFLHIWSVLGTPNISTAVRTTPELQSPSGVQTLIMDNILWIVFSAIAAAVLGLIAHAGIILKATAREKGKSLSFAKALSQGVAYVPRLILAFILAGLIVGGPFLAFIIIAIKATPIAFLGAAIWFLPMMYIGVRLALIAQACVVRDLGPIECLRECWRTTKGNFWLIFVTAIILSIISMVIGLIPILGNLISLIVVGPAGLIAFTLIYLGLSKR